MGMDVLQLHLVSEHRNLTFVGIVSLVDETDSDLEIDKLTLKNNIWHHNYQAQNSTMQTFYML